MNTATHKIEWVCVLLKNFIVILHLKRYVNGLSQSNEQAALDIVVISCF